jgi:tetratricopeptide (TPR) repeat protein
MKTKLPLAATAALLLATFAFGQTPATPPPDAAALHQQSLDHVKQKKFKEAAGLADQATKADPTKPEYFSQLGVALSQRMSEVNFMQMAAMSGRMKKAFEKSIELDPHHVAGLIGLARFHTNAPEIAGGSLVKAAEFAARVQKLDPFLGELELGRVAEKAEKPAEALAHYEAAAKANPKSAGVLAAAGRLLAQAGKKDEARARFEAALKINPEHELAKKGLADLNTSGGKQ